MQATDVLLTERYDRILVATMNRPERMNALGGGLPEALNDTWLDFRDDPDLSVMIITGAGDRAFCAGADLKQNDERARALGAQSAQAILDATRFKGIRPGFTSNNFELRKPVIAAINGWCLAGGCEMAMGCDLRIIEEQAQIGLPEVKRGMGAKATTHKLYFLTTLSVGLEMVLTGDPLTAQRAYDLGLVNEIVAKGQSLARAKEMANAMCRFSLPYLRYHKERFFQSIGVPVDYALAMQQRFPPHESEQYHQALEISRTQDLPGWSRH